VQVRSDHHRPRGPGRAPLAREGDEVSESRQGLLVGLGVAFPGRQELAREGEQPRKLAEKAAADATRDPEQGGTVEGAPPDLGESLRMAASLSSAASPERRAASAASRSSDRNGSSTATGAS
jgi:hypothetical protein